MNTDNMSVPGETIDYGPCAFIDTYQHNKVFSSIDRNGRYAYNNQPGIGLWSLTRLAETLLPLLADDNEQAVDRAQTLLGAYATHSENAWLSGMRSKCGLTAVKNTEQDDKALIEALLNTMVDNNADFTLTFTALSKLDNHISQRDEETRKLFDQTSEFDNWAIKWRERVQLETQGNEERQISMQAVNPVYIPRNHQIEPAIRAAEDRDDFSVFHELHEVLQNPYVKLPGKERYESSPEPHEIIENTFCGT